MTLYQFNGGSACYSQYVDAVTGQTLAVEHGDVREIRAVNADMPVPPDVNWSEIPEVPQTAVALPEPAEKTAVPEVPSETPAE